MLIIGLLLILAAVAVAVGAVYDGGDPATVEILGRSVDTTVAGVFFAGLATMLVLILGLWMVTASMGRARRKRAQRRELKAQHRDSVAQLEEERSELQAENERLSRQLSDERSSHSREHWQTADHGATSADGEASARHRGAAH